VSIEDHAAHNKCNLKHRETKNINLIFHNLKGSDSHLIVKAYKESKIVLTANMDEKYMQMKFGQFVFLGHKQHLNRSLEDWLKGLMVERPFYKQSVLITISYSPERVFFCMSG